MNPELNPSRVATAEPPEPTVGRRPVPVWLLILLLVLLYWAMVYFDLHGAWFEPEVYAPYRSLAQLNEFQPPPPGGCDLARGKAMFESICGLCHGNDGMGKPAQAPPLAGSEWVLGSPNRLIRIPQLGLFGPIQVKGQQVLFPSGMAPMGAGLSDSDLANALCYIRKSWGNNASEITEDQVKAVRAELAGRAQQTTPDELLKIPEK